MDDTKKQIDNVKNNIIEDSSILPPPEESVIFYNDDYTAMNFVVEILISIFNKSEDDANDIMMSIHSNGSSVVGTYTYDIAESRKALAINTARKNGFPLRIEIE
ncbi:MAG: ATP-dependent Clp protease adaptor ClpS [Treponema sp.]|jgi:ATP-dependent Clp protease adaptor protein ClpS|nr:ATP-dependent Clp protease adaptor ClpS [Treponema sp.]